jgi:TetR/AcrR family transcriptional regulator, cholesterol catabolism regulator
MPRDTRFALVLKNTAKLFSQNGFVATSLREVAAVSRISKAGLYYHIREKEDLLYEICRCSMTELLKLVRERVAASADPVNQLKAIVEAHTDFFRRHPHNLTVLNQQMGFLSRDRRREVARMEREYLDLIRDVIRDGRRQQAFRDVDVTVAAFSLLAVLNTLDGWYHPQGRIKPSALVQQLEVIALFGLATRAGGEHEH